MRKINSNGYGPFVVATSGIFLCVIPICLSALFHFTGLSLLRVLSNASTIIGAFIGLLFAGWLAIELRQDRKADQYYESRRNTKKRLRSLYYECQSCGCIKVTANDRICPFCGVHFIQKGENHDGKSESHERPVTRL